MHRFSLSMAFFLFTVGFSFASMAAETESARPVATTRAARFVVSAASTAADSKTAENPATDSAAKTAADSAKNPAAKTAADVTANPGRLPTPTERMTGYTRQEIRNMPILERPSRPGHFYGNAVRRRYGVN